MDLTSLLATPIDGLGSLLSYVIPFIVVMSFIVFFHELGHFLVARWCGVKVEVFSIGFGREIVGWHDRHGTRWRVAWIPLGGYVRFKGDADAASGADFGSEEVRDPDSFHAKPLWQRALVVAAGPLANFLLAIVLFAGVYAFAGVPVLEPVVDEVVPGSAAEEAGIRSGDRIVAVNGREIRSFTELREIVAMNPGEPLRIVVEREGRRLTLVATPRLKEMPDGLGGRVKVGVLGVVHRPTGAVRYERAGPLEAVGLGVRQTWNIIAGTMKYLKQMILGQQGSDQLAGPIRIAQVTSQAASVSLVALISLAAVLSVSIGLINLFPIPMLDGGHLLYYAIEAVRGRPLSESAQEFGFKVGMMLVLSLMLLATFNDIRQLFMD
jgi:regulator of sigma E protease